MIHEFRIWWHISLVLELIDLLVVVIYTWFLIFFSGVMFTFCNYTASHGFYSETRRREWRHWRTAAKSTSKPNIIRFNHRQWQRGSLWHLELTDETKGIHSIYVVVINVYMVEWFTWKKNWIPRNSFMWKKNCKGGGFLFYVTWEKRKKG